MSLSRKVAVGVSLLTVPFVLVFGVLAFQMVSLEQIVSKEIPASSVALVSASRLDELAQMIRYYDEVLTSSARSFAFTGDDKWKRRYDEEVGRLDAAIKEAMQAGDEKDREIFKSVDAANLALVAMEEKALKHVEEGEKELAVEVLESKEYWRLKAVYGQGLEQYVQKRGLAFDRASVGLTQTLELATRKVGGLARQGLGVLLVGGIFLVGMAVGMGFYFAREIGGKLEELTRTAKEMSLGNLNLRTRVQGEDEIGQLAQAFNEMAETLASERRSIEEKVKERTKDLEQTNKAMVGRELKMVELKEKLKKYENSPEN